MDAKRSHTCAAIIPARMASSRLPGKVLADIGGKAMLHHVVDAAQSVGLFSQIVVATDSVAVMKYCDKHEIHSEMTSADHATGTSRVAEVALGLDMDTIVNIQADEPFISEDDLVSILNLIQESAVSIASLCCPLTAFDKLLDYNVVKVTKTAANKALYFSRQAIPALRDKPYKEWIQSAAYFQHLGVYGYKKDILKEIVQLPSSKLEMAESLEQLRWLEHGYEIHLREVAVPTLGVDTPEDLALARQHYKYVLSKK